MARRRDESPPPKGRRPRRGPRGRPARPELPELGGVFPFQELAKRNVPRLIERTKIPARSRLGPAPFRPPIGVAGATLGAATPTVEERLAALKERVGAATRQAIPTRQEFFEPVTRAQEAIPTRADLEWLRRLMDIMGLGPIKRTLTGEEPFPWRR